MATSTQNLTVRLHSGILRKAKVAAARRSLSISGLVTQQIEALVGEDEAYERAERQAMALLEKGMHLGSTPAKRDSLHER